MASAAPLELTASSDVLLSVGRPCENGRGGCDAAIKKGFAWIDAPPGRWIDATLEARWDPTVPQARALYVGVYHGQHGSPSGDNGTRVRGESPLLIPLPPGFLDHEPTLVLHFTADAQGLAISQTVTYTLRANRTR